MAGGDRLGHDAIGKGERPAVSPDERLMQPEEAQGTVLQAGVELAQQHPPAGIGGDGGGVGVAGPVEQKVLRVEADHIEPGRVGVEGRVDLAQHEQGLIVKGRVGVVVGPGGLAGRAHDQRAVQAHGHLAGAVGRQPGLVDKGARGGGDKGVGHGTAGGYAHQVGEDVLAGEGKRRRLGQFVVQDDGDRIALVHDQGRTGKLGRAGNLIGVAPDGHGGGIGQGERACARPQFAGARARGGFGACGGRQRGLRALAGRRCLGHMPLQERDEAQEAH